MPTCSTSSRGCEGTTTRRPRRNDRKPVSTLVYLDAVDPQAAARARRHYECLQPFEAHPEGYGLAAEAGEHPICRDDVVTELLEIQRKASRYARIDERVAADQYFYAEQNARVVARAEEYHRAMLDESISTWNLRDTHMLDTLERLIEHLSSHEPTRAVVWAHNSHVGDAGATSMAMRNETNVGALARRRFGDRAVSIGFTTYGGMLRPHRPKLAGLAQQARERAIGVIYRPESELYSHYFTARLIDQFDALYHFDITRAVQPLEPSELWENGEPPKGYPTGI